MEGVGEVCMSSASTSSAEPDVRCDKTRSGSCGECNGERMRRRGSTVAAIEAEGPLIFSAKSGDSGSPTCGGVLAGEDKAFI